MASHLGRLGLAQVLSFLVLAACALPIKTAYDSDPSADFTRYRTYAWISEDPLIRPRAGVGQGQAAYISPIDDRRIRQAVDADLAAKGYRRVVGQEGADLVVSYSVGTQEKTSVQQTAGSASVYYPGYGYGGWYGGSPVRVRTYTEGTLALEFFDRASKQAVWVGWGSKRLSREEDSEDVINRAVTKILAEFPVRSG